MAVGHIAMQTTPRSTALRASIDKLLDGVAELVHHRDTMIQMQDGGVSTDYIVQQYGFEDDDGADAGIAELSSLVGKLTTNASVTDVAAAIKQVGDKFR